MGSAPERQTSPGMDYTVQPQDCRLDGVAAEPKVVLTVEAEEEADCTVGPKDDGCYTVGEAIDHIGLGPFQWLMLFYSGCAWAADAMEMMLLSFLGPAVRCEWDLSAHQESLITSVVFAGTMAGAYAWGALADSRGRRSGFFGTAVFTCIFGLLSAAAPSYRWLVALRALVGVGLGGVPVSLSLFLELAPSRHRGALLVALQAFWSVGSLIEAGLAWGIFERLGWRWLLGLSSAPLAALMVLYPVIPESPFWLASVGQSERAEALLRRMARTNGASLPPGRLRGSVAHAEQAPPKAKAGRATPTSCAQPVPWRGAAARAALSRAAAPLRALGAAFARLLAPGLRLTSLLLMAIWFVNALSYYGLVLLTTTIHTGGNSSTCGVDGHLHLSTKSFVDIFITSAAELPGLLAASLVMDWLGRKRTLCGGMAAIAGFSLAMVFVGARSVVPIFGARASSMGAYAVLYIYTPEMYPTRARAFALGVNNAWSRVGAVLAPFLAVDLAERGRAGAAAAVIAALAAAAAIAVLLLPRDTAGQLLVVDASGDEGEGVRPMAGTPRNSSEDLLGAAGPLPRRRPGGGKG